MQFDNTNQGVLFKNDKGDNQSRPDYKGTINVNGTEFWLAAWIKSSKAGKKYMSLSVQTKEPKQPRDLPERMSPSEIPRGGLPEDDFDNLPF